MKVGFSLILSGLITVTLDIDMDYTRITFVALIMKELMVGFIIGFISYAFFYNFLCDGPNYRYENRLWDDKCSRSST